ncbi:MAG: SGNH/GDSL hydrolase family protein [Chthoniobacterales bacterium]
MTKTYPTHIAFLLSLLFSVSNLIYAAPPNITPTKPASLKVEISAGDISAGNASIAVKPTTITVDPPEIHEMKTELKGGDFPTPENFAKYMNDWEPWPSGPPRKPTLASFTPRFDDQKTMILGALYRYWRPDTLVVYGADGEPKTQGEDYYFNADWGQIANKDNRLGQPGNGTIKATIEAAIPRIDLLQVDNSGAVSVKKGESQLVCPEVPEPDEGKVALAGIYIAPWLSAVNPNHKEDPSAVEGASEYAVTSSEIFPIKEVPEISPVNIAGLSGFAKKLSSGAPVKIAFLGDSITVGAEAPRWFIENNAYTAKDKTFRGRFVVGLRDKYPGSDITPIPAYQGGKTTKFGGEIYKELVEPEKPDLVVVAFGANDVDGGTGGNPKTSPEDFKSGIESIVDMAKAQGADVLLINTFPFNPWILNDMAKRQIEYNKLLEQIATEKNVTLAPVYEAFKNAEFTGMPAYNTLHNWKNHPGDLGHEIYAETLLETVRQATN